MVDVKTIVAATDLSELSLPAVHHASDLAKQFDATLHVIAVVPYPFAEFLEECQSNYGSSLTECEERHFDEWKEALDKLEIDMPNDKLVRVAVKGLIIDEINDYVTKHSADLLVVGTHGYSGLKHILMGSTAETLVRLAPCPILTVRSQDAVEVA